MTRWFIQMTCWFRDHKWVAIDYSATQVAELIQEWFDNYPANSYPSFYRCARCGAYR